MFVSQITSHHNPEPEQVVLLGLGLNCDCQLGQSAVKKNNKAFLYCNLLLLLTGQHTHQYRYIFDKLIKVDRSAWQISQFSLNLD